MALSLKWVLVSCYGYLRFREFKLGIPTSHMAICAYARETLLNSIKLAEEHGFEVVHAIVDSLYIRKKDLKEEEVRAFCRELELQVGIPLSFEGIFKWVVFLPSLVDSNRALPSTYYGVFRSGDIKCRGIEARQRSSPAIVRQFQTECIRAMASCSTEDEIRFLARQLCRKLRMVLGMLSSLPAEALAVDIRVGKTEYKNDIPQRRVLEQLKKKGIQTLPGQFISYAFGSKGAILLEDYKNPDIEKYQKLLRRALFNILQPFGITREYIREYSEEVRQSRLEEFYQNVTLTTEVTERVINPAISLSS